MAVTGRIALTETTFAGDQLLEDHTAGDGELLLENATDFNETVGTLMLIDDSDGEAEEPITQIIGWVSSDEDTDIVVLDGVLEHDFGAGTEVRILPIAPLTMSYIETDDELEPLQVEVPQSLVAMFSEQLADQEWDPDTGPTLLVEEVNETFIALDVVQSQPLFNGEVINPNSTIPPAAMSDGEVPVSSPTVIAIGAINTVYLRLDPATIPVNADPLTYDWYVDGDFAFTSPSSLVQVSGLVDGTPLPYNADTEFHVIARDPDGPSEEVGASGFARPIKVSPGDLAQTIIDDLDAAGATADAAQAAADQALADALAAANAAAAAQSTANAAETPMGAQDKANAAASVAYTLSVNAAALDATAKAAAAQSAAASTAAADATAKANAAQAAAVSAANAAATLLADGAEADAIAAAQADATTKANAAKAAAEAAAALDATAKAAAAQSAATAAAAADATTKANAAQTAAGGYTDTQVATKGKIIAQPTAPSGSNQNANNLWINTTGGANTPNRWNPTGGGGSGAWEPVTDKVASDAATAAYNAQVAADAATSAASTAQSTANGKNKVVYSGANASSPGSYAAGDTWFKYTSGILVGQWRHDGSAWQPLVVGDAMVGNLDAAKITTGFLNVAILIEAGAITADLLEAEYAEIGTIYGRDAYLGNITATNLASVLTFSSLFRTAESGRRGEWDVDGLRFYNSAGSLTTSISGDDAFFSGDVHATNLETDKATLGGATMGPPGGTFKVGAATLTAPTLALVHASEPLEIVTVANPTPNKYVTHWDGSASVLWAVGPVNTGVQFQKAAAGNTAMILNPPATTALASITASCGATSGTQHYAGFLTSGQFQVARKAGTWIGADPPDFATAPENAPGTGGFYDEGAILGVQWRGSGLLVAHRVKGAQTIGGQSYADKEVMVRRYTVGTSGSFLTLSLVQTVKTGLVANGALTSVLMDVTSGMFDLGALASNTAMALSCRGGFTAGFSEDNRIIAVPNSGATVTASIPSIALGASAWYSQSRGVFWDDVSFWTTDLSGNSIRRFGTSAVAAATVYHAYTYYNSTLGQETMLSPIVASPVYARNRSRWSIPALPLGVDRVRVYESLVNSPRTRFERVRTDAGTPGQPLQVTGTPIAPPVGSATNPPPATSNYINGNSYQLFDDFGGSWKGLGEFKMPKAFQSGETAAVSPSAADATTTIDVVYSTTMQSVANPSVTCISTQTSATQLRVWITNKTATGFRINFARANTTATAFSWTAIAM